MNDLRKAAQQALEALGYHVAQTRPIHSTSEAIDALRAALAQPERKPLTDEQCNSIEHKAYLSTISKGKPMGDYAKKLMRAIERAHGIGGEA